MRRPIAEIVAAAHRDGADVGANGVTARYDPHAPRRCGRAATLAVDLLNRSLLSDFLPVQGRARARPVPARPHIGPLRRAAMREGRAALGLAAAADARRGVCSQWRVAMTRIRATPFSRFQNSHDVKQPISFSRHLRPRF